MTGASRRIWGLMYRHLALYRRSWPRLLEIAYFPILQMLIWGFTQRYLAMRGGPAAVAGGVLLGGALLWEVALRAQMGFSITFLEEVWSRNLGHLFVSPIRPREMLAALMGMSVLRTIIGVLPAALLAWVLYRLNLLQVGPVLALFVANLMLMGWAVALAVVSMILRHGAGAEPLAWSFLFGLAPLSAVFYPVATLPVWLRPVSLAIPATHVFEGLRAALSSGIIRWDHLGWALALNGVWLMLAAVLFLHQFRQARSSGALVSMGE